MKYIIIGYTSDIDIKSNTAKIRYFDGIDWSSNVKNALKFDTRYKAEEFKMKANWKDCITYGIEE